MAPSRATSRTRVDTRESNDSQFGGKLTDNNATCSSPGIVNEPFTCYALIYPIWQSGWPRRSIVGTKFLLRLRPRRIVKLSCSFTQGDVIILSRAAPLKTTFDV